MQIPSSITSRFGRQILLAQKNAPQILFAGGISAGVASTVLACKATLRLETKLGEAQADLTRIREVVEVIEDSEDDFVVVSTTDGKETDYTLQDAKKDLALVYAKRAVGVFKLYAPAIGFGIVSVALLTKSQHILHERNAGLAAAYAAVDKAFSQYRERVREDHGEEKDLEYMHGVDESEIINPETGRKKKVKHFDGPSMYARVFDKTNGNWEPYPDHNLVFLSGVQSYANDRLQAKGHVFLNDVYDDLGLSRTRAGSQVGWIRGNGDNSIDFGIHEGREFNHGRDGEILLDFNVDGVMWNLIDESGETNWLGEK